ncbi:MAG TPA: MarR family transcriptional regulator [Thermoanaerobaculia bacterium]|nr:MarR family transcriptional regulator [Thermoanaerobaculia bacterium]
MVKRRRLSDGQRVLNSFRNLVKALRLADRAGVKRYGLGASQIYVLHELNRSAPLSINELAERTATDQSTVSVVVNNLVGKGYVARERSDADARRAELALTRKGKAAAKSLPPPIQEAIIRGVEQLPRARARSLADAMEAVIENMGIADENPPMLLDDARKK